MQASEAMRTLARAGRRADAVKIIERHANRAANAYDSVRADDTRTDDYKRAQLSDIYNTIRADVERELGELARGAAALEQRDAAAVFGTVGVSGDAASLVISRRDASDRVAATESKDELRALLHRANRTGDEILARAVAEKAFDNRDGETLNLFLETRSHLDDAAQRLWDGSRAEEDMSGGFADAMQLYALKPPEIR